VVNDIASKEAVKDQYENSSNLDTRISIHRKYSVNQQGFNSWIFSNYEIKAGSRILELGCGTGVAWKENISCLRGCFELVLTDLSEGMLKSAKESLKDKEQVSFNLVDIQSIPYEDRCFDVVIANMMLYHVPDINKGLSEVKRVLRNDGVFYCATFGENGIVEYLSNMLGLHRSDLPANHRFTLQNGKGFLMNYFLNTKKLLYEDSLEVTDIDDLMKYLYSLSGMDKISRLPAEEARRNLTDHMVNGVLTIPKEYGMFVCKNK